MLHSTTTNIISFVHICYKFPSFGSSSGIQIHDFKNKGDNASTMCSGMKTQKFSVTEIYASQIPNVSHVNSIYLATTNLPSQSGPFQSVCLRTFPMNFCSLNLCCRYQSIYLSFTRNNKKSKRGDMRFQVLSAREDSSRLV